MCGDLSGFRASLVSENIYTTPDEEPASFSFIDLAKTSQKASIAILCNIMHALDTSQPVSMSLRCSGGERIWKCAVNVPKGRPTSFPIVKWSGLNAFCSGVAGDV